MKRTPLLRRSLMKHKRPKHQKPFPDGLHEQVINRDGMCIIKMADESHVCHDLNGPHDSTDKRRLTVDHFWPVAGGVRGLRAKHTLQTLTAMCLKSNVDNPPSWVREYQRDYVRKLYGDSAA